MSISVIQRDERSWMRYLSVAIVSFSALTFELVQTRVLSYIFWNHVVYLAISIALLGFGISGTLVTWMKRTRRNTGELIPLCTALMSATLILSVFLIALGLRALPHLHPGLKLMLCYLVSVPPFIFAGAALSLILAYSPEKTGKLYFCDLVAAGIGCAAFFILLPAAGAIGAICTATLLVAAVTLAWLRSQTRRSASLAIALAASVLSIVALSEHRHLDYVPERYKEMGEMLGAGANIERTKWTPLARIDVVGGKTEQLLNYREHPVDSYKIITQDGSAHTRLVSDRAIKDIAQKVADGRAAHPSNIPYEILRNPDVAIIGTGGGIDVAYALANHANSVFAIELNPYTYSVTSRRYADYNGHLVSDPRVHAIHAEGRNAIRSTDKRFDLLQIIAIDTFAALNAGAYVLSENYLYTVQAFEDYFSHLKPNGMVALYRWNSFPPKETLRLVSLASEAWRREGVQHFSDRVMVIGDPKWALTIFKNGNFTQEEADRLGAEANRLGQYVFLWPKVRPQREQQAFEESYYSQPDHRDALKTAKVFSGLVTAFDSGTQDQFFREYPYKVTPTTDDSPFFFESTSLSDLHNWSVKTLRGSGVQSTLIQILIASTIAMICAIFIPLMVFHREGIRMQGAGSYVLYFAALGFGFMLLEVALMQKAVLVLGNPMYSIPTVLSSMLFSAGIGSAAVSRWRRSLTSVALLGFFVMATAVAIFGIVFTFGAPTLLRFGMTARVAVTIITTLPIGFALGFFFPAGLQEVRDRAPIFVPWAWGINGCASVYGSLAATFAAMWHGFNVVLVLGAATYLIAVVATMLTSCSQPIPVEALQSPRTTALRETA